MKTIRCPWCNREFEPQVRTTYGKDGATTARSQLRCTCGNFLPSSIKFKTEYGHIHKDYR